MAGCPRAVQPLAPAPGSPGPGDLPAAGLQASQASMATRPGEDLLEHIAPRWISPAARLCSRGARRLAVDQAIPPARTAVSRRRPAGDFVVEPGLLCVFQVVAAESADMRWRAPPCLVVVTCHLRLRSQTAASARPPAAGQPAPILTSKPPGIPASSRSRQPFREQPVPAQRQLALHQQSRKRKLDRHATLARECPPGQRALREIMQFPVISWQEPTPHSSARRSR